MEAAWTRAGTCRGAQYEGDGHRRPTWPQSCREEGAGGSSNLAGAQGQEVTLGAARWEPSVHLKRARVPQVPTDSNRAPGGFRGLWLVESGLH